MSLQMVQTAYGTVQGTREDGAAAVLFKGIPYARPPIGNRRWKRPEKPESWQSVRVCDHFSPTSIQGGKNANPYAAFYDKEFYPVVMPSSEDCLYLNVWTPAASPEDRLPVMFWIHGGGFGGGYGHEMEFDGEAFARQGVILVTINYRTGLFGFMAHPELSAENPEGISGNYGIFDQIAALAWVRENIAAFGGDSDRITIFGQSAGAKSVEILCATERTHGMMQRAVMHSGGGIGAIREDQTLAGMERIGEEIFRFMGADSLEAMRAMPAHALQEAIQDFRPSTLKGFGLYLVPNIDNVLLDRVSADKILRGEHNDLDYMLGFNRDELAGFTQMEQGVFRFAENQVRHGRRPAHVYSFERKLPGDDAGSFHTAELWYVFGSLGRCWRPFTDGDYRLSKQLVSYWCNFAKTGDPNGDDVPEWPAWLSERRAYQMLDLEIETRLSTLALPEDA